MYIYWLLGSALGRDSSIADSATKQASLLVKKVHQTCRAVSETFIKFIETVNCTVNYQNNATSSVPTALEGYFQKWRLKSAGFSSFCSGLLRLFLYCDKGLVKGGVD